MPKFLKMAWNITSSILIGLILVLAVLLVGVRVFGIQPYTVISGSMEPEYPVGSMIYVVPVDPSALEEKDPVTFYLNGSTVATHRIIEVLPDPADPDARYFRTKGDANTTDDGEPFHSSKLIGKPIFSVPYLGYFSNFIQHQPGRSIALGVSTFILIAAILPSVWSPKKDKAKSVDPDDEEGTEEENEG